MSFPALVVALGIAAWSPQYEVTEVAGSLAAADDVTRDRYPIADAVIVEHGVTIRFESERPADGYVRTTHLVSKVLTPSGREVAENSVNVSHDSRLVSVSGRTGSQGKIVGELPDKSVAFYTASGAAGILYTDARRAWFRVPSVVVGHVVEVETKTKMSRGYYIPAHYFDGRRPVQHSWISMEVPAAWRIGSSYSEEGAIVSLPHETKPATRAGWVVHTWRKRDLEAYRPEPLAPSYGTRARRLRLSVMSASDRTDSFAQWSELGAWYRDLVGARGQIPPKTLAALKKREPMVRDAGSAPHISLFRFVRDRIRYVAIHEGIGAYQPHKADEVLAKRYGDCKDMATVLVALYADAGVRAYPVLIGTREMGVFDRTLPSVSSFNHAIVAIAQPGGGYEFADPTDKRGRYGHLHWRIQGRHALVVKADGVELVRTPVAVATDNARETLWRIERDGTATMTVILRGAAGAGIDRRRAVKQYELNDLAESFAFRIRDKSLTDASIEFADEESSVTIRATFQLGKKKPAVLPMSWFVSSSPEYRVPDDRRSFVDLGMPFSNLLTIDAELSDQPLVWSPAARAIEHEAFRYRVGSEQKGGRIRIERSFEVEKSLLDSSALGDVRRLGEALKDTALDAVVFAKKEGI